jgi:hypothetical protein
MDMSTMIANHLAEAARRSRRVEFRWTEHGARDAAARLFAATIVVAIVFAALEFGGPRQTAGTAAAPQAGFTASTGRHSLR